MNKVTEFALDHPISMVPIAYVGTTNVNSLALTANGAPLHIVKTKEWLGKKKARKVLFESHKCLVILGNFRQFLILICKMAVERRGNEHLISNTL